MNRRKTVDMTDAELDKLLTSDKVVARLTADLHGGQRVTMNLKDWDGTLPPVITGQGAYLKPYPKEKP